MRSCSVCSSTAEIFQAASAPPTIAVVLDRPFLFVVHDVAHAKPHFNGRVADPG